MQITDIVDAIIELINNNIVAATDLTADASSGDTTLYVENSFQFSSGDQIAIVSNDYNTIGTENYQIIDRCIVKEVIDTTTITITTGIERNWLVADEARIQKAIGFTPLFSNDIYFGDREVIAEQALIAVAVEPVTLTNSWLYLQGGLDEEFRVKIMIYAKDFKTENGMKVLSEYSEAIYQLLNENMHFDINDYQAPLTRDITTGDTMFYVCNTAENREYFVVSDNGEKYEFQDNLTPRCTMYEIEEVDIVGNELCLTVNCEFDTNYYTSEFGIAIKMGRYVYDSRVDNVTWGVVQKGSALLRAAELDWFSKEVNEYSFPQFDKKVANFDQDEVCGVSSSSED